ncbi:serine/threonine protein phosphatase, partial [Streptomyces sp. NPDC059885]
MTEHPTSHEGRQPLAARSHERTRPRQEAAEAGPSSAGAPGSRSGTADGHPGAKPAGGVPSQQGRPDGHRAAGGEHAGGEASRPGTGGDPAPGGAPVPGQG